MLGLIFTFYLTIDFLTDGSKTLCDGLHSNIDLVLVYSCGTLNLKAIYSIHVTTFFRCIPGIVVQGLFSCII